MSIRHRVRRVRPLPLLLAVALLCAIVGGALGTATVPPTTTSPLAPYPSPHATTGAISYPCLTTYHHIMSTPALNFNPNVWTHYDAMCGPGGTSKVPGPRTTPRYRMGGRVALTPPRPTAIPTRLSPSYHGAISTPRPTIAPRAREPMSPTALKTAVANSAGKGR